MYQHHHLTSLPAVSYDDDIEILDVPTPSSDCAKACELLEAGHVELIESVRKMEIQAHHKPARSGENRVQEDLNGLLTESVGLRSFLRARSLKLARS